jgi:hypothetical protein
MTNPDTIRVLRLWIAGATRASRHFTAIDPPHCFCRQALRKVLFHEWDKVRGPRPPATIRYSRPRSPPLPLTHAENLGNIFPL